MNESYANTNTELLLQQGILHFPHGLNRAFHREFSMQGGNVQPIHLLFALTLHSCPNEGCMVTWAPAVSTTSCSRELSLAQICHMLEETRCQSWATFCSQTISRYQEHWYLGRGQTQTASSWSDPRYSQCNKIKNTNKADPSSRLTSRNMKILACLQVFRSPSTRPKRKMNPTAASHLPHLNK